MQLLASAVNSPAYRSMSVRLSAPRFGNADNGSTSAPNASEPQKEDKWYGFDIQEEEKSAQKFLLGATLILSAIVGLGSYLYFSFTGDEPKNDPPAATQPADKDTSKKTENPSH